MAELIPNKLKVTELREELAKRNLSTAGLKKDLVERLEKELSGEGEVAKSDEHDQFDLLPADEQEGVDMDAELDGDMDADGAINMEPKESPVGDMDVVNVTEEEGERKRKLSNSAEHGLLDMQMDSREAHGAKGTQPGMLADKAEGENKVRVITDSLFIKNLERPLTVFRMKELLGQYGTVDDIWLNSIKTRAYASFATKEDAEAAFNGTNGVQFPPEHGKVLESGFITRERMQGLIGDEELKSDDVHSIDLVPVPEEDGNCGIALINPGGKGRGKGAFKRQKMEARRQADKVANQASSLIIAAASAAATEAKNEARDRKKPMVERANEASEAVASARDDGLTRRTKALPELTFRPLTDAEVAAKKASGQAE
ncbi:hypothetical protein IW136_002873 [Coemansia sp. RSA 678]|nr:hypothetical protein IW136_002873 [Coemansia sp. RSA 678]